MNNSAETYAPLSLSRATRLAGSSGSGYKLRSHSFIRSDVARLMLLGRRFSTGGRISSSLELGDVGPERDLGALFLLTGVSELLGRIGINDRNDLQRRRFMIVTLLRDAGDDVAVDCGATPPCRADVWAIPVRPVVIIIRVDC